MAIVNTKDENRLALDLTLSGALQRIRRTHRGSKRARVNVGREVAHGGEDAGVQSVLRWSESEIRFVQTYPEC